MIIYVPALVSLLGLIVYFASKNGEVKAIAKDCFWCGLLVTLLQLAGQRITLP